MSEELKPKRGRKPAAKKVDAKTRKQILAEEKDKLEKVAEKIALKTMTEVQLANQVELAPEQKEAAKLLASGLSHEETADKLGKKTQEVVAWMQLPSFVRLMNEYTMKDGFSDKNERIRKSKRIAESLSDAMLEKISNGDLENMSLSTLSQLAMNWAQRVDSLVDKKEEKNNKDLTVLILNHVQSSNGKKYDKLQDFLEDPDFSYPTIDTEATEVKYERD